MIQLRYPNLVKINGVQLTDETRSAIQESRDERSVIVQLASGKNRKFIKGIKKKWSITWDNVSMDATQTVDGFGGRNEIRALAQLATTMTFILQDGTNSPETYTIFIDSYQETLLTRRVNNYRYSITLELEEQ